MLSCFKPNCLKTFSDCTSYKFHLKNKHLLKDNQECICSFSECKATFSRISNFFRHLSSKHGLPERIGPIPCDEETSNTEPRTNIPDLIAHQENSEENNVASEKASSDEDNLDSVLSKNLLNFLIGLHSKGNVTKKLIIEVFNDMKSSIIDPILKFTNVSESKIQEVNALFQSLNTLYKFEKRITEMKLLLRREKIIVRQQIGTGKYFNKFYIRLL